MVIWKIMEALDKELWTIDRVVVRVTERRGLRGNGGTRQDQCKVVSIVNALRRWTDLSISILTLHVILQILLIIKYLYFRSSTILSVSSPVLPPVLPDGKQDYLQKRSNNTLTCRESICLKLGINIAILLYLVLFSKIFRYKDLMSICSEPVSVKVPDTIYKYKYKYQSLSHTFIFSLLSIWYRWLVTSDSHEAETKHDHTGWWCWLIQITQKEKVRQTFEKYC